MALGSSSILIVGAGPVGLSLALGMARRGVRADIVDMAQAPSPFCRAIGVSPRTLEVLETMGVSQEILDAGLELRGRRTVIHQGADVVTRDQTVAFPDLPYGQYLVPQDRTERILERALARHGIAVARGVTLTGLVPGDTQTVRLEREGVSETSSYDYVVGCDGAHSTVRKALAIPFEGEAFPFDFMLGDVTIDWDLPRGTTFQAIRPATGAAPDFFVAIPLPERQRYRISMMAPSQPPKTADNDIAHGIQVERGGASLAQLQEVADRLVPGRPKLADLRWSSIFRISMRLAERYRVGGVFLAGDACHIHPPTGGQGMNTGIQDADNLAWKIALAVRGDASAALLDSYEAERRPIAEQVIAGTVERSTNLGRHSAPPGRLHDTQILVSYASGPLVSGTAQGRLSPGDRMPDIWGLHRQGTGFPLRLFDLTRGSWFTLIAFPRADELDETTALVRKLRAAFPGLVAGLVVLTEDCQVDDIPDLTLVRAKAETVRTTFDGPPPPLVLLRPDGYVGFTGPAAFEPLRRYLERFYETMNQLEC